MSRAPTNVMKPGMVRSQDSRVLLTMKGKDQNPEEAAWDWLRENEAVWSSWVPAEVAQKVKQALEQ